MPKDRAPRLEEVAGSFEDWLCEVAPKELIARFMGHVIRCDECVGGARIACDNCAALQKAEWRVWLDLNVFSDDAHAVENRHRLQPLWEQRTASLNQNLRSLMVSAAQWRMSKRAILRLLADLAASERDDVTIAEQQKAFRLIDMWPDRLVPIEPPNRGPRPCHAPPRFVSGASPMTRVALSQRARRALTPFERGALIHAA